MKTKLAQLEGLYVGFSASANIVAAIQYLEKANLENNCVATILCDTGFKYSN